MEKISFEELLKLAKGKQWSKAVIVFTKGSFNKPYSEEQRSYKIYSDAKIFNSEMIGTSLFGDCLDGTDQGVRLDIYMKEPKNRWEIDYCYILE